VGYCPQQDIIFDNLAVEEHLKLICEIKNVPREEIKKTIDETLEMVMLLEYRLKLAKNLSGGMKRKLSLAMALVSKPKLIILDEPTSGLDLQSRI